MAESASSGLARLRLILWALVVVAALGATALFVFRPPAAPGVAVAAIPAFATHTASGESFSEKDLQGTPSLVFFGYTNCPDICPTTLSESVLWKRALGVTSADIRTIFVTVDPARDTPDVLSRYIGSFDPDVVALVGDDAETEAVKAAFNAQSSLGEKREDGFYLVNHTASVFLIDRQGRFQSTIAYGEDTDTAVGKIRRLIGG